MNNKMQIKFIILFVGITLSMVSCHQNKSENISWGTKTLYQPLQSVYQAQTTGYEPVYINYVGRHGARHLSGIDEDSMMFLVLKIAKLKDGLTSEGKKLINMDSLLLIVERGNVGLITEIGKKEQRSIGKRMMKNYPSVFNSGNIKVSTTKKERTKQSARAFMQGLNQDESISVDTVFNDQDHLAFYDVSPTYKMFKENGEWKGLWADVKNSEKVKVMRKELPERFFKTDFINKMDSGLIQVCYDNDTIKYASESFIEGFYGGCSIIPSIKQEIEKKELKTEDLDFASLVSCKDMEALDYLNTAEDFLVKGPATDSEGIQVKIAAPLLSDFLQSTEKYISTKETIANLRFAHAETISPFAALLGISGASESVTPENIKVFNKTWKCEEIIPLSANIQWILYKNKSKNDFLIKFLLNEKEATINGLKDCGTAFYYNWADVKDFYTKKLEKLGVHPGDDMHEYLMNVK